MGVQGKGPTDRETPRQGSRGEMTRREGRWRKKENREPETEKVKRQKKVKQRVRDRDIK